MNSFDAKVKPSINSTVEPSFSHQKHERTRRKYQLWHLQPKILYVSFNSSTNSRYSCFNWVAKTLCKNKMCVGSADDHLIKELSFLRKILQQFILGHPNKILTLLNVELVGCNHLRLEKELLKRGNQMSIFNIW